MTHTVRRSGVQLPVSLDMTIHRGGELTVSGPSTNMEALGQHLGQTERPVHETGLVPLAFGNTIRTLPGQLIMLL